MYYSKMRPMNDTDNTRSDLAPVLVMAYNRPKHLKRLLLSLSSNVESKESKIFISIDGPKTERDVSLVNECRNVAAQDYGFLNTIIWTSEKNRGLANSVINSVNKVLKTFNSIVVLEDDLLVSNYFLNYMNAGLNEYAGNSRVAAIHGYQYPLGYIGTGCVFKRGTDCWGWGTWRNQWETSNFDARYLLNELQTNRLKKKFDLGGFTSNFKLLNLQLENKIDSWAIRWHASMFLQEKFTLYPPESLVLNLGLDGSGTHEGNNNVFETKLSSNSNWNFPKDIKEDRKFLQRLMLFYLRLKVKRLLNGFRILKRF